MYRLYFVKVSGADGTHPPDEKTTNATDHKVFSLIVCTAHSPSQLRKNTRCEAIHQKITEIKCQFLPTKTPRCSFFGTALSTTQRHKNLQHAAINTTKYNSAVLK